MAEQKITAQQRAMLFGASTRQHYQTLGSQTINGGAQSVSFRFPKSRLVAGVKLHVKGTLSASGAGEGFNWKHDLGIYDILRRVSIDFNNGFNPIVVAGSEMALINMLYPNPEMVLPSYTGNKTLCKAPASLEAGIDAEHGDYDFEFVLDIPLTLNYRDPVGLILAQNGETSIDLICDFDNLSNLVVGDEYSGGISYNGVYKNVKITPMITSYSIPADTRAFPDLSVLKVVDSRNEAVTSGQNYIKLPVGMIYRKLILKFVDENGQPMKEEDITSNIELILNTADTPYSITPAMLRFENTRQAGMKMPEGVYFFSFDYQGMLGYGGSRDYIDTERVSEFAVRFTSGKVGKVYIIAEKLSRLIAG